MKLVIIGVLFSLLQINPAAKADDQADLKAFLKRFHENPKAALDERPMKYDSHGNPTKEIDTLFTEDEIQSGEFVEAKDFFRKRLCTMRGGIRICLKDIKPGRSGISPDRVKCKKKLNEGEICAPEDVLETTTDKIENFLETPMIIRSLREMESRGLAHGEMARRPWSDTYWPIAKGIIANRFADGGFPNNYDWASGLGYIQSTWGYHGAASSPSEKYDYMLGDSGLTLTSWMWAQGRSYQEKYGSVPRWMGICHGWSPSSIVFPEPLKKIEVRGTNGATVTLWPSDVKGIADALWANEPPTVRFVGGRCKVRGPARDRFGRVEDPDCFDTNPGTFHMAITNQIGNEKRGFIMDATYDFEVWNHPIVKYEYFYFNPQTLEPSPNMRPALVRREKFVIDKFKERRSPDARFMVGVSTKVTYATETGAYHREKPDYKEKIVRYVYDLELDASGNVIGGEWYTNVHPDFLWSPPLNTPAISSGDSYLKTPWDPAQPIPVDWTEGARVASRRGAPLAAVVRQLVSLSSSTPIEQIPGPVIPMSTPAPESGGSGANPVP